MTEVLIKTTIIEHRKLNPYEYDEGTTLEQMIECERELRHERHELIGILNHDDYDIQVEVSVIKKDPMHTSDGFSGWMDGYYDTGRKILKWLTSKNYRAGYRKGRSERKELVDGL